MEQAEQPAEQRPKLTDEEREVLVKCRRESVLFGIPYGLVAGVIMNRITAMEAVPQFFRNGSRTWTACAAIAGYLLGISTYRNICMERIMKLENSHLGNQMRKHLAEKQKNQVPLSPREKKWMDEHANRQMDIPEEQAHHTTEVPSTLDKAFALPDHEEQPKPTVKGRTFEDIRQDRRRIQSAQQPRESHDHDHTAAEQVKKRPLKKNKYGDIVYDDEL